MTRCEVEQGNYMRFRDILRVVGGRRRRGEVVEEETGQRKSKHAAVTGEEVKGVKTRQPLCGKGGRGRGMAVEESRGGGRGRGRRTLRWRAKKSLEEEERKIEGEKEAICLLSRMKTVSGGTWPEVPGRTDYARGYFDRGTFETAQVTPFPVRMNISWDVIGCGYIITTDDGNAIECCAIECCDLVESVVV